VRLRQLKTRAAPSKCDPEAPQGIVLPVRTGAAPAGFPSAIRGTVVATASASLVTRRSSRTWRIASPRAGETIATLIEKDLDTR
jgi:hypothetical protein